MAKKGPLGKAETFYIDSHRENMTVDELAKDLDRTLSSVKKYLSDNPLKSKQITVGDQFTRQKGVTIMTENASSMADAKRKAPVPNQSNCVTKIKE